MLIEEQMLQQIVKCPSTAKYCAEGLNNFSYFSLSQKP